MSVPEPFRTASDSGCISSDGSGPYPVFPAIRPTVVLFDAMRWFLLYYILLPFSFPAFCRALYVTKLLNIFNIFINYLRNSKKALIFAVKF